MKHLSKLSQAMIDYYTCDPKRIQHFIKVHAFAKLIGEQEGLSDTLQLTLEAAALVHDIGILPAERKFGNCNGKLQEQEGVAPAQEMLTRLQFPTEIVERVCFLVGHHHTYTNINGLDYQILVEADFLVNFFEENAKSDAISHALHHIFKTNSGCMLCRTMFGLS